MIKDIAIAISLANLCFIKVWTYVNFTYSINNQYYSQVTPNFNYYFAAVINILLLAAFFWVAMTLARRTQNSVIIKFAKVIFILATIIPVYIVLSTVSKTLSIVFIMTLLILLLRIFIYYRRDITGILAKGVLIFFAFFLFNLSQPALLLFKLSPSDFLDKQNAEAIKTENKNCPRILWIIFDEMGQRLTFEERSSDLELPEIDRFRSQAIYANNAFPPAGETDLSLPALITGEIISKYEATRPYELLITKSKEDETVGWSTIPNVFSRAYDLGFNTALVGWYHPYGRIIGNNLTCFSWHHHEDYRVPTISEAILQQIELFIKSIPMGTSCGFLESVYVTHDLKQKDRVKSYVEIMDESIKVAVNPELGLTFLHLPVPHPPVFYDRKKNNFIIKGGSYLDNLALVDRALGELRIAMDNTGIWEKTIVIISSDHWLRTDIWGSKKFWINEENAIINKKEIDHRVPFMLKLAGQKEGIYYEQAFNTIITHDLILALLKNEISSPDDVAKWIDNKRLDWEIPDYSNGYNTK